MEELNMKQFIEKVKSGEIHNYNTKMYIEVMLDSYYIEKYVSVPNSYHAEFSSCAEFRRCVPFQLRNLEKINVIIKKQND